MPKAIAEYPSPGLLLLDKPSGMSSNHALQQVKHYLYGRSKHPACKMGYLGTLDPLATGLLVLFVGSATRLIPLFEKLPKSYQATIQLGIRTDTLDAQGTRLSHTSVEHLTSQQIRQAVWAWRGEHPQETPAFSAVKKNGIPAYQLARNGKLTHRYTRQVCFHQLEIQHITTTQIQLHAQCSAGTYIRALARDIGEDLGVGAHLTALRRTAVGCSQTPPQWTLDQSITLSDLLNSAVPYSYILEPSPFLPHHLAVQVAPQNFPHLSQGRPTPFMFDDEASIKGKISSSPPTAWHPHIPLKALDAQGRLLAIGEAVRSPSGWQIQPRCVMSRLASTPSE